MHTKGPWTINRTLVDGAMVRYHISGHPYGSLYPICEKVLEENDPSDVWADACLIATAPDMLAVLEDVYHICGGASRLSHKEQTAVFQRMRRTIAKAKGE